MNILRFVLVRFILVCVTLITGFADVFGQQVPSAVPGPAGNYIICGKAVPRDFSYRIERSPAQKEEWGHVATTAFRPDSTLFFQRLAEAGVLSPSPVIVPKNSDDDPKRHLWDLVRDARNSDSLYYYASFPACLVALGVAWYDTTAVPGVDYRYRVSLVRSSSSEVSSEKLASGKIQSGKEAVPVAAGGGITNVTRYPAPQPDYRFRVVYAEPFEQQIAIRLYSDADPKPAYVRIYRQPYMQGPFEELPATAGGIRENGRLYYLATDTAIRRNLVYRYFAVPFDTWGNPGLPSDTVRIAAQTDAQLPVPLSLKATGDTARKAIRISWSIPPVSYLQQIRIYRSFTYDAPDFVHIGTAGPNDTAFYDADVAPATTYYYSMVLYGPKGPGSPSIRIPGLLPANARAIVSPPIELEAAPVGNGKVQLRWVHPPEHVLGFFVYRSSADSIGMQQVSGLIRSDEQKVTYVDTIASPKRGTWSYTVRSVNNGYGMSEPSDTVRLLLLAGGDPVAAPLQVRTAFNGETALIYWNAPHLMESGFTAFNVYRAVETSLSGGQQNGAAPGGQPGAIAAGERLNADPLPYNRNFLEDTTFSKGVRYRYWVEALTTGNEARQSPQVALFVPAERLYSPGQITARAKGEDVILSWEPTRQDGIREYHVYRVAGADGGSYELIGTLPPEAAGFTDSAVPAGSYYYTVTCVDQHTHESPKEDWIGVAVGD